MEMKNIIMECDSKAVIEVLNNKRNLNNHPNGLIRDINRWKDKNLNIYFVNIFREGNRCVDCLARKSVNLELCLHFWDTPPKKVVQLLVDDEQGASLPRIISV
ncbi:hypothetical protein AHAS_Ahas15G0049400 [Arachis hypogaea]